jgi:cobaltochelatase CobN
MLSQFLIFSASLPSGTRRKVVGLKLIPPEELKRPRIDATVRITGVKRDAWPTIVELMDDAAQLAAAADEPDESNYIRKHNRGLIEDMKLADINEDARKAAVRIFGDAPGSYGAGIDWR